MKNFTPILLAAGIFSLATAQNYPTVTPDDVDQGTREGWCTQQTAVCPNLCQDQSQVDADINECDPDTLEYKCICMDGSSPNLTEYSLTLPYFLCQKSKSMCADNCKSEQNCVNSCITHKKCGASNPTRVNSTTVPKPGASSTSTSTQGTDAAATGGDPFDTKGLGATFESWGSAYGVAAMIIGMAVGFAGVL